jgi:hypothetical protein
MVAKTRALFDGAVGEIVDNFQHHRQGLLAKLDAVRQRNDGHTPRERRLHRGRSEVMCRYDNYTKKALQFGVEALSESEFAHVSNRQGHGPKKHHEGVSAVEHDVIEPAVEQAPARQETPPEQPTTKTRTKIGPKVKAALLDAINTTPANECIQWTKHELVRDEQISAATASQWCSTYRLSRGNDTGLFNDETKQGVAKVIDTGVKLNEDCGNLRIRAAIQAGSGAKRTGRQVRAHVENRKKAKEANCFRESEGASALVMAAVARQQQGDIEEVAWGNVARECKAGYTTAATAQFLKASPEYACASPRAGSPEQQHMDNLIAEWCAKNNNGELSTTVEVCKAIAKAKFQPFVRDGLNYHSTTVRERMKTLVKKPLHYWDDISDLDFVPVNVSTANEALVKLVRKYCDTRNMNVECIDGNGVWKDFARRANLAVKEEYKYKDITHIKIQFYITDSRYVEGRGKDDQRAAMLATIKSWMTAQEVSPELIAGAPPAKWRQLAMDEFQKEEGQWRHSIYLQRAAAKYAAKLKSENSQW